MRIISMVLIINDYDQQGCPEYDRDEGEGEHGLISLDLGISGRLLTPQPLLAGGRQNS
jgi:hypothetical protein